ncbi:tRNA isopentenyl-2-thiomethyl-A-37 hydroxylase MiaE [Geothrix sp. PMB-07]|uniref:tRNA isopentenyl-2-thiomethyl-A-37 hydroxylase MiaE n=1 Tax=Geothrix sp. PMB-07 TaxID=3068640 RepID=UPI00274214E7|nr:tRNA isopentenyl-2-thiomethyl-A-37 hydroxylase MiaE [Geothrix sp. PMB-07]WLT30282.1 tRNA isopentenyl-2-thiomethyl-A-37 hydroxylase MiaE [Geothrix sp. PMB-07]
MTGFKPPLPLRAETPAAWAEAALADPAALLSDHAHNEKKAALNALNLSLHLAEIPRASVLLARLAEEELNHYRRVLEALMAFGWPLRPDGGNAYAKALHQQAAKGLLDRLLIAALIEARSCERLWLLERAGASHPELGSTAWLAFLLELERCEAGHALGYRSLAEERFGAEAATRLDWWLDREAEVIQSLPWRSAVH